MFHEITVSDLSFNPFTRLNKDWALVTVTDPDTGKTNTMTVSWGGVGVLWGKNVVTIYIRPQRYTHEFLEKTDHFTLSFYDMSTEGMRDALTSAVVNRDVISTKLHRLASIWQEKKNTPGLKNPNWSSAAKRCTARHLNLN